MMASLAEYAIELTVVPSLKSLKVLNPHFAVWALDMKECLCGSVKMAITATVLLGTLTDHVRWDECRLSPTAV